MGKGMSCGMAGSSFCPYRLANPQKVPSDFLSPWPGHRLCTSVVKGAPLTEKTVPYAKLKAAWWTLRISVGLAAFLAGADKFFNFLTDWSMYLSPMAERMLPVSGATFMHVIGPVEMLVGAAILTRWTRVGAYAAAAWLTAIAVNLAVIGSFYDLAVRDVEIATAAYVLARLTEILSSTPVSPAEYSLETH